MDSPRARQYLDAIVFENGRRALHLGAINAQVECVEALVDSFASLRVYDTAGCTPLHYAAGARFPDRSQRMVGYLLTSLVSLNLGVEEHHNLLFAVNGRGRTALHEAAVHGNTESVRLLCAVAKSSSADRTLVNKTDGEGYTSIELALRFCTDWQPFDMWKLQDIVDHLVRHGAVLGDRAMEEARSMGIHAHSLPGPDHVRQDTDRVTTGAGTNVGVLEPLLGVDSITTSDSGRGHEIALSGFYPPAQLAVPPVQHWPAVPVLAPVTAPVTAQVTAPVTAPVMALFLSRHGKWFLDVVFSLVSTVLTVIDVVMDGLVITVYFQDGDRTWGMLAATFIGVQWLTMMVVFILWLRSPAESAIMKRLRKRVFRFDVNLCITRSSRGGGSGSGGTDGVCCSCFSYLWTLVRFVVGCPLEMVLRICGMLVLAVTGVELDKLLELWERGMVRRAAVGNVWKAKVMSDVCVAVVKAAPIFNLHVYVMLVSNVQLKYATRRIRGRGLVIQVLSALGALLTMSFSTFESVLETKATMSGSRPYTIASRTRLLIHGTNLLDVLVHVLRLVLFAASFHGYLLIPLGVWLVPLGVHYAYRGVREKVGLCARVSGAGGGCLYGITLGSLGFLFGPFLFYFAALKDGDSAAAFSKFSFMLVFDYLLTAAMVALPFLHHRANHLFNGICESINELTTIGNCFPWWLAAGVCFVCLLQLVHYAVARNLMLRASRWMVDQPPTPIPLTEPVAK